MKREQKMKQLYLTGGLSNATDANELASFHIMSNKSFSVDYSDERNQRKIQELLVHTPSHLVRALWRNKHVSSKQITELATEIYKTKGGRGITYTDLLETGLAVHKRHAQDMLKYHVIMMNP